jgi:hypothetical protein
MKKITWIWSMLFIVNAMPCLADEVPWKIGPFILGQNIMEFASYIDVRTELPIRYMESVKEVEIKPIMGFKSGLIAYGSCKFPGRIVRIKLKYQDSSKAFFNTLRKKIEARYGKFEEYRGDPFKIVIGWKKSFKDNRGNKISMIIQHNTRDDEEKIGNSIKMTLTSLLEDELNCQQAKWPDQPEEPIHIKEKDPWDFFTPR